MSNLLSKEKSTEIRTEQSKEDEQGAKQSRQGEPKRGSKEGGQARTPSNQSKQPLFTQEQNLVVDSEQAVCLENGQFFGPISIRYETYGALNSEKSNAILVAHAFSGSAHAAGYRSAEEAKKGKPGWWDSMIGPGKSLNTDRYYIICSNVLGGCMGTTGPSSENPATGKPYALDFPVITIQDMVKVEKLLVDHLGIDRLLAVVGGSMGGMQVLEWSIAFPNRLRAAIIIASTDRLSTQGIAFNAVGRNAIMSDADWMNGNYYASGRIPRRGLSIARMIGHITYLSTQSMKAKFGRRLQTRDNFNFDFEDQFQVESYLEYQGDRFVDRFDANSYIYLSKAMDYYDAAGPFASLGDALKQTLCSFLVISYSSDWLFPADQVKELVYALMRNGRDVSYIDLDSPFGHDAFLLETERQSKIVTSFLESIR